MSDIERDSEHEQMREAFARAAEASRRAVEALEKLRVALMIVSHDDLLDWNAEMDNIYREWPT